MSMSDGPYVLSSLTFNPILLSAGDSKTYFFPSIFNVELLKANEALSDQYFFGVRNNGKKKSLTYN